MPAQLTPFDANSADAQDVLLWMQVGLDGIIEEDVGRWAFRPLEHYIGIRDDLVDDLRAIYQDLGPDAQGRWRSAIRDPLAMLGRDLSKGDATRVLIDLVALVRARDVLDVLPKLMAGAGAPLLDQVVRTAVALVSPTDVARACIERIRTSPSFSPDYPGLVLVALCYSDPDGWQDHAENLVQPMSVLASRLGDESTALRLYACGILDAIGLSRVVGADLKRLTGSAELSWPRTEWLGGPNSLLRYDADSESGPRILHRPNGTTDRTNPLGLTKARGI